jgi:hypothetical protein
VVRALFESDGEILMPRALVITALAAAASIVAGITPSIAADFGDSRDYRNENRGYAAARPVPRDYDEDDDVRVSQRSHDWNGGQRDWNGSGYGLYRIQRVEARASYASDYLPFHVKQWRARESAIANWKAKVATRYGEHFAHWRPADEKSVICDAGAGSVYCTVSARPVRGWRGGGWGWNTSWR